MHSFVLKIVCEVCAYVWVLADGCLALEWARQNIPSSGRVQFSGEFLGSIQRIKAESCYLQSKSLVTKSLPSFGGPSCTHSFVTLSVRWIVNKLDFRG